VSEKEQSEALRLLAKFVKTFQGRTLEEVAIIREAQAFLRLPVVAQDVAVEAESHGQRRG